MFVGYLAEPHVHERVPGLADLPHIEFARPWCHQARGHATWVRCVQTSQLVERGAGFNTEELDNLKMLILAR